jgi:hypothetical protein
MKPIKIVPVMFKLEWEDGTLSEDCYNLTRANDILRNYDKYMKNMKKRDKQICTED